MQMKNSPRWGQKVGEKTIRTLAILIFFKKNSCHSVCESFLWSSTSFLIRMSISRCSRWWTGVQELYQTLSWISARCSLTCTPPGLAALYISSRLFTRAAPSINYNFNDRISSGERRERYLENKRQNVSA